MKSRTINHIRRAGVETDRGKGGGDGQSPCPAGSGHTVHWQAMPIVEKSANRGDEMLIQNTLQNTSILGSNQEAAMAITQL